MQTFIFFTGLLRNFQILLLITVEDGNRILKPLHQENFHCIWILNPPASAISIVHFVLSELFIEGGKEGTWSMVCSRKSLMREAARD